MANADSTPATNSSSFSAAKASDLINILWERVADDLTNEELKGVSNIGEYAEMQARNLAQVVTGIGCTISSDGAEGSRAGSFEDPDSLTTLLFTISHGIDTIAGMMEVSNAANSRLLYPELYKL